MYQTLTRLMMKFSNMLLMVNRFDLILPGTSVEVEFQFINK